MLRECTKPEDRRAKEVVSIVETDRQASRALQMQAKDQAQREVRKGEEARTRSRTQLVKRSAAHFSIPRVASPVVSIMQIRPRVPLWSTTIRSWTINSTLRLARLLMEWKYLSISKSLLTMSGQEPRLRCTKEIRMRQWRPSNTWIARKVLLIEVMPNSRSLVRSLEATQPSSTYPQASTPSQNPKTSSASQTYPDMQTLLSESATLERVLVQIV